MTEEMNEEIPSLKVILVGNSGVGKTSLVSSFFRKSFDNSTCPNVSPAYSYADIKYDDKNIVRLKIWDTAGQEKYLSMNRLFYRDSDVALICYDPLDTNKTNSINEWADRVKSEVPECELLFILTKCDTITPEQNDDIKQSTEDMMDKYGSDKFFITSALTREGVDELFNHIAILYHSLCTKEEKITSKESKRTCC